MTTNKASEDKGMTVAAKKDAANNPKYPQSIHCIKKAGEPAYFKNNLCLLFYKMLGYYSFF